MDVREFLTALAFVLYTYHFGGKSVLNPRDVPQSEVQEEYDFIIVGAGSAGSVLANRLTERKQWKVLLIEAGGDEPVVSRVPLMASTLTSTPLAWNYTTTKQRLLCQKSNNECDYPQGHVMGGGSSINVMMYVRGNKADFDEWAELGNAGWSYDDVLPYFKKMETVLFPQGSSRTSAQDRALRGRSGPLRINYSKFMASFKEDLLTAGLELGYERGDYNGVNQSRIDFVQNTCDGVARQSSSSSYLNPARNRKNLFVVKNSLVTKIVIENETAIGVEYVRDGGKYRVNASREVILSGGAINSAKILMLSGIGPRQELEYHGIEPIKDLPVGANLQDHPLIRLPIILDRPAEYTKDEAYSLSSAKNYAKSGSGPLTSTLGQTIAFKGFLGDTLPNGQWFTNLLPSAYKYKQSFDIRASMIKPKSRGTVTLRSSDPSDDPVIDPNFFQTPADLDVMREVLKEAFRYIETPTMTKFNPQLAQLELCNDKLDNRNALIDCLIANYSTVFYHPVGTARMGLESDNSSVVNSQLQVHGVRKFRVIDSSVMPCITRGNTNAATIMIAEKGADLVKKTHISKP